MAPAVLVRGGPTLRLVREDGSARELALPAGGEAIAWLAGPVDGPVPAAVVRWLAAAPLDATVAVEDERLARCAEAAGRGARFARWSELREVRERAPRAAPEALRRVQLELAALALERALSDPEQVLISLAREEERLERALGRETSAVDHLLVPAASEAGVEYLRAARGYRDALTRHHASLRARLESLAREVAPNLTAIVGSPLAPRLVAAAGGTAALARMSGARIQLLGARRRPSPVRGPRFGHLYRAPRMDEVPRARTAAYARSLAALAAIAVRADVHTRRDISEGLLARRDRRIRQLQRGR